LHALFIIQKIILFIALALNSAEGGSLFRIDWLKTPNMRLNSYAIITLFVVTAKCWIRERFTDVPNIKMVAHLHYPSFFAGKS
jgi:hypothetical protein